MIKSKQDLELVLSKLESFQSTTLKLEQYATPENIAAEWIWNMALLGDVNNKVILDAACGPGILGLAALLMGARRVYFLDKDKDAIKICMKNYNILKQQFELGEAKFIIEDISIFDGNVDVIIQNPPFGTKQTHADKRFLEKAFTISRTIYTMHKISTERFVEAICNDNNFKITHLWKYDFVIKQQYYFHRKPRKNIKVGLWRLVRSQIMVL